MHSDIPDLNAAFDPTGWKFSPGPPTQVEPVDTVNCFDVVELPLAEVTASVFAFPGVCAVSDRVGLLLWPGQADLTLTVAEWYPGVWGGIYLEGNCSLGAVIALWTHLLSRHSGIWLFHTDREPDLLHTPRSFFHVMTHGWGTIVEREPAGADHSST